MYMMFYAVYTLGSVQPDKVAFKMFQSQELQNFETILREENNMTPNQRIVSLGLMQVA